MHNATPIDTIAEVVRLADRDLPYLFGRQPHRAVPFLFSARQCSRMVNLRCRLELPLAERLTPLSASARR